MIEQRTVAGKPAIVAYLRKMQPVRPSEADMVKVSWEDGRSAWLLPKQLEKYDPDQPRDDHGRWSSFSSGARSEWPDHIKALGIPPGWKDVRFNQDPNGDLLAVGVDAKGRMQYVYSSKYEASQAEAKFERIRELQQKMDAIQAQNRTNENSPDAGTREAAELTSVIMATGIRPGSDTDTGADTKAYGATTLEGQHVVETADGVSLQFPGKSGVSLNIPVTDAHAAQILTTRAALAGAGKQLFPLTSDEGLRAYVATLDGGGFKTKDFRTALGTSTALKTMGSIPAPKTLKEYKKAVKQVATAVSTKLGNTPTVALQSYIDPTVFGTWRNAAGV